MKLNRKLKRKKKMRRLEFPNQKYTLVDTTYKLDKSEGVIGLVELLWAGITRSEVQDLTKKDYKVIKKLRKKIKAVTVFKDKDEDSRVTPQECTLYLENDEYDMLVKLLNGNKFLAVIAEELDSLWSIIDEAKEEEFKPQLVSNNADSITSKSD
jgi:hypothetical protein